MSVRSLCVHTLTLTSIVRASDGAGGWTDTETDATVSGRIRPTSARERLQWAGQPHIGTHVVYLPPGVTATNVDTITYGSRAFRVLGVRNPDELSRYSILDCEEVD